MNEQKKIPFTIITGFLGSGKTTLLSHWLREERSKNAAVIVNEFGAVGLDHRILRRIEEKTKLLSGGCVCCNIREDLIIELSALLNARQSGQSEVDQVIIETTGLADPAPILFSIFTHPVLQHHFYIRGVVTTVDAVNGALHIRCNPAAVKQIAAADKIILTKADLADSQKLHRQIQRINPAAKIFTASNGILAPSDVLADDALSESCEQKARWATDTCMDSGATVSEIYSVSIRFYEPLDWVAFGLWLSMLLHSHGENMFRVKGIVDVGGAGPVVLNGVQHIIHPPQHLESWESEERRSEIVFIMKKLTTHEILASLQAFQNVIGAKPEIEEVYSQNE